LASSFWCASAPRGSPELIFADPERLGFLVLIGRVTTRYRIRYEQCIRRQADQLTAFHAIDLAITGSTDIQLTLKVLMEQVVTHLKAGTAKVLPYNPKTNTLEYGAGRGLADDPAWRSPIPANDGILRQVTLDWRTARVKRRELSRRSGLPTRP
jgi:hypothetical protein